MVSVGGMVKGQRSTGAGRGGGHRPLGLEELEVRGSDRDLESKLSSEGSPTGASAW